MDNRMASHYQTSSERSKAKAVGYAVVLAFVAGAMMGASIGLAI